MGEEGDQINVGNVLVARHYYLAQYMAHGSCSIITE